MFTGDLPKWPPMRIGPWPRYMPPPWYPPPPWPRLMASLDPAVAARADIAIARTVNFFIVFMALSPFKKSGDRFFTELVECRRRKGCAGHHNRVDCHC